MVETIIFDWKRTLYSPDTRELLDGASHVLEQLGSAGFTLFLVGKDPGGDMPAEISRLGVATFFSEVHFVRDTKTDNDIGRFINLSSPQNSVVVGDRVRSEIAVGNRLGALTIWVQAGKFATELPVLSEQTPDYTVNSVTELPPLIESI